MFGNYVVDHGTYKLTIQNLIKKEFEFMPGGTIAFGGGLTIAEIADQVGFNTPSYFTKSFKKLFGVLPTQYNK